MRPLSWVFGLLIAQQAAGAVVRDVVVDGVAIEAAANVVLPPTKDPWYTAPRGFEFKKPGDILRIRVAPGNLTTLVGNPAGAYHILYRTTDARNKPSWAVTTLFIPSKPYRSPSGKGSLLSYQFAYNSANVDSGPSLGLYWRLAQEDEHLGLKSDTGMIRKLLAEGWIFNTPDYLGPDASFGASLQAGHATIDSIRAVLKIRGLTAARSVNTVMWGYSGGTIATAAAAELLPSYAPELKIAGALLGGLVDDISADFDNLNKSPIAGTMIAALLGITSQFPEHRRYLESALKPANKTDFLAVVDTYVSDTVKKYSGKDIYTMFKCGAASVRTKFMQKLYDAQAKIGHRATPTMPMFIYKAIGDQYCPVGQTDATVDRWCDNGADIKYDRNTVGSHVTEIENGKPRAREFLWKIFSESYKRNNRCSIQNVTITVAAEDSPY